MTQNVTVSAMDLREQIGDILSRVRYTGQRFVVERRGAPVVAIISIEDLEWLERLEAARDAELLQMAKAASEGVMTMEDLLAEHERNVVEQLATQGA